MTQLAGFSSFNFDYQDFSVPVFVKGTGPAIIIIHEVPGITPQVIYFAERVAAAGFTVVLPSLFGTPGKAFGPVYALESIGRACIRKEFAAFEANKSGPIADYMRVLCRLAHEKYGGKGVGALGMCFTGNFALSLMVEPSVLAGVLSQPSLPIGLPPLTASALHTSPEDLAVLKKRIATEDLSVLGLRFTHDFMCPKARFDRLRDELGEGFEAIEIDSGPKNQHKIKRIAHSVLTMDLVDKEGHPTRQALDRVLSYFQEKLL
ncbi:dienelactone hydrolase family protein [Agitococcus lubricus]|uniref:Dienelactone hydrolase n=1 Tax=Agitococcus lubricus TaxID=1077255 RepID=A0A2T5J3H7_9GAMM|nr:dienelactone hydrolase family protein [Agitococcus lubricus]PTQ91136.1 dienelactone hydrolase [Agitococcus lubricus]